MNKTVLRTIFLVAVGIAIMFFLGVIFNMDSSTIVYPELDNETISNVWGD